MLLFMLIFNYNPLKIQNKDANSLQNLYLSLETIEYMDKNSKHCLFLLLLPLLSI
jgi:hypothetical protein